MNCWSPGSSGAAWPLGVGTGVCTLRAAMDSVRPSVRRRKSAAERRQQRDRAAARAVGRLLAGFESIASHRGCRLSRVGTHVLAALQAVMGQPAVRHEVPSAESAVDGSAGASPAPCGPPRDEGVPVVVQGGGAALHVPHLGLSAGQGGQGQDVRGVEAGSASLHFHARLRARVRVEPSSSAGTVGFLQVGDGVRGVRRGRWVELRSGGFRGGFVLAQFADGEVVLADVPD